MIFNSLGSNYRAATMRPYFKGVILGEGSTSQLELYLSERYNKRAVLTHKGRQALRLALESLHLEPGSAVAINGYTCYAVYDAVTAAGLTPVYVDVPKNALNFTAKQLEQVINLHSNIRAVVIQNTLGMAVNIGEIERVCEAQNVRLVEDLAHSIGLIYPDGREAGTVGDVAILSFSQDKVVDGVSGGALLLPLNSNMKIELNPVSAATRLRESIYMPLSYAIRSTYSVGIGKVLHKIARMLHLLAKPMDGSAATAQKMSDWQANLVLDGFKHLSDDITHRQNIAALYHSLLPETALLKQSAHDLFLRFPVVVAQPHDVIEYLSKRGVFVSDTWYDAPVSPKKLLSKTNYRQGECPNAEAFSATIINLPTHTNITEDQARLIAEGVNAWLSQTA